MFEAQNAQSPLMGEALAADLGYFIRLHESQAPKPQITPPPSGTSGRMPGKGIPTARSGRKTMTGFGMRCNISRNGAF